MSESAVSSKVASDPPDNQNASQFRTGKYRLLAEQAGLDPVLAGQFALVLDALELTVSLATPGSLPTAGFEIKQRIGANSATGHLESRSQSARHRGQIHPIAADGEDDNLNQLCGMLDANESSVIDWLKRSFSAQADNACGAIEAEPDNEPTTIHEVASALLKPYSVRDGQARLAGCTLDETAQLRVGWVNEKEKLEYRFLSASGERLATSEIENRGLAQLHSSLSRLRAADRQSIAAWVHLAGNDIPVIGDTAANSLIDKSVIWSRRAMGKIVLQFESGRGVSVPFDGWARDYANGLQQPPMYHCAISGLNSYHLVELDDGSITVAEAVGRCEISGAEMFLDTLARCHLTGKTVAIELLGRCAVSGQWAIESLLEECQWCGRWILPGLISSGVCKSCLGRGTLEISDPGVQQLIAVNPELESKLKRGNLSGWLESDLGLIVASRFSRETLFVFDPRDGVVVRHGSRRRPFGKWQIAVGDGIGLY